MVWRNAFKGAERDFLVRGHSNSAHASMGEGWVKKFANKLCYFTLCDCVVVLYECARVMTFKCASQMREFVIKICIKKCYFP